MRQNKKLKLQQQQSKLVLLAQNGDKKAQDELIISMAPLINSSVKKFIKDYSLSHDMYEDLVNEGYISIVSAIKKYNPDKKTQFWTYSYFWIKQQLQRYIARNKNTISTPFAAAQIVKTLDVKEDKTDAENYKLTCIKARLTCQDLEIKQYNYASFCFGEDSTHQANEREQQYIEQCKILDQITAHLTAYEQELIESIRKSQPYLICKSLSKKYRKSQKEIQAEIDCVIEKLTYLIKDLNSDQ